MSFIDIKKVNFVNNGILHLFSRINYFIIRNEIDSVDNLGIATAIKGIIFFNDDIAYHDACWKIKSTSNIINKDGCSSIFILLKIVVGFFEDYTNYIYRIHQELKFIRENTNCNNTFLLDQTFANAYTIIINLSEIIWRMFQYKFSLGYEAKINTEISSSIEYKMYYRY